MVKSAAKRINGLEDASALGENERNDQTESAAEKVFMDMDNGDRFTPVALRMITTEPAGAKPD